MANITLKGNAIETVGTLPSVGSAAPDFTLVQSDLSEISLKDYAGKKVVLNIFPSIDTGICAASVRRFNEGSNSIGKCGSRVCVSADLPFALQRFCGAEEINNVATASSFRSSFGNDYGVSITTGPLAGVLSRCIVIVDESGNVTYTEQVPEIAQEPDFDSALKAL